MNYSHIAIHTREWPNQIPSHLMTYHIMQLKDLKTNEATKKKKKKKTNCKHKIYCLITGFFFASIFHSFFSSLHYSPDKILLVFISVLIFLFSLRIFFFYNFQFSTSTMLNLIISFLTLLYVLIMRWRSFMHIICL